MELLSYFFGAVTVVQPSCVGYGVFGAEELVSVVIVVIVIIVVTRLRGNIRRELLVGISFLEYLNSPLDSVVVHLVVERCQVFSLFLGHSVIFQSGVLYTDLFGQSTEITDMVRIESRNMQRI